MDLTSLYTQSTTIKTETADGQNTAERVGSLLYAIVGALEEIFTTTANDLQNGLMSVATYNTVMTSVKRLEGAESELNKHGGYINTLQITQGNIQNDVSTLQKNITDINGKLGEPFDRLMQRYRAVPNCETIGDFNLCINVTVKDENSQGLSIVPVYGIPMLVVTAQTNRDKNVWMQTLFGCVSLSQDKMSIAEAGSYLPYVQLVRYFNKKSADSGWGEWESINPSAQTAVAGTNKNYVYSQGKSEDPRTLISSKFWIYQHGDGNMFFRVKHWGAANDKNETDYSQVMIPNAWTGANGLLRRDVYSRLDSFALREENSTTTQVNIITPIFTTGGTRKFSISCATSAKAGVMTAEMYNTLKNSASRIDQATCLMPESYLPTANSGSIVAMQKADYIRMAKAILYGGYVCIRKAATKSDKIDGNYLVPVTEAQAKYTDDDNFRVRFVYNGNRYSVRCSSGTMSHYLEENYAPDIKAQIAALTARIEALEKAKTTV